MTPRVELVDRGVVDYVEALELQRELFERLVTGKNAVSAASAERPEWVAVATEVALPPNSERRASTARALFKNPFRPYGARSERLGGNARSRQTPPEAAVRGDMVAEGSAGWLILCEHPHVYTLGKSGRAENLLVSPKWLEERGVQVLRTERGGDITYHGPGQIVGYPVLDLDKTGMGLRRYIEALEQSVIETVARFGIEAGRKQGASGVWVRDEAPTGPCGRGTAAGEISPYGDENDPNEKRGNAAGAPQSRKPERKICAIGVRASRGVVMHGFALNVATDLAWFEYINPCGFAGGAVTSMEKEAGAAGQKNTRRASDDDRREETLTASEPHGSQREKELFSSKMAECKACEGAERGAYSNVCDELGGERNEAGGRFSRKPEHKRLSEEVKRVLRERLEVNLGLKIE